MKKKRDVIAIAEPWPVTKITVYQKKAMCAAQMSCSLEPKKYNNTNNKCQGYVIVAFVIFLFIVFRLFAFSFSPSII